MILCTSTNKKDLNTMLFAHKLVHSLDAFTDRSGRLLAWLSLAMALLITVIVVMRYGFNTGSIFAQGVNPGFGPRGKVAVKNIHAHVSASLGHRRYPA